MEPSPLHLVSHTHYYRSGDVFVDASAAIAPGVVLRAAPTGAIRIGPGVCVGAGVVIQARLGCVFIETGVSLGTGVLIVGHGHVGKDACVGPSSTLINPAIAPNAIIPPCALVEAVSSQIGQENGVSRPQGSNFHTPNFEAGPVPSMPMEPRTSPTVEPQSVSPRAVNIPEPDTAGSSQPADDTPSSGTSAITSANGYVYGRDHLNSLLSSLFPYRQPLDSGERSDQSEKDS
ncbi:MAG: hypothetical protein F6K31_33030 [Symploca sp. SIO2G7]|nr:hypothetical protein [Symploca sp. SIO2G7]